MLVRISIFPTQGRTLLHMRPLDKIGKPLIIRPKKQMAATPCGVELATLLTCWRSLGVEASHCADSSRHLLQCMVKRVLSLLRLTLDDRRSESYKHNPIGSNNKGIGRRQGYQPLARTARQGQATLNRMIHWPFCTISHKTRLFLRHSNISHSFTI